MSVIDTFILWYAELQVSITKALNGPLKDGLEEEIKKQAQSNVYNAYGTRSYRRGKIGDKTNLSAEVNGFDLHIRNVTVQQGSPASQTETGFVEEGTPAFHQPFPRPFMDEALTEYAHGKAPDDLADALRSDGFAVM